jgi:putative flippase GtrA
MSRFLSVLTREGIPYGVIGVGLIVVDWATFVALSWLGVPVAFANVSGRIFGALLGFWLNGRYTFARADRRPLGRRQFLRYCAVWLASTVVSTLAVDAIASHQWLWLAWLAKPAIDATLAGLGFLASKYWIYR